MENKKKTLKDFWKWLKGFVNWKRFKGFGKLIDRTATVLEFIIALSLLLLIAVHSLEHVLCLFGVERRLLNITLNDVLYIAFTLVIGIEFVKLLCLHNPISVIQILFFATARYIVVTDNMLEMVIGIFVMAGVFAVKKFFVESKPKKEETLLCNDSAVGGNNKTAAKSGITKEPTNGNRF